MNYLVLVNGAPAYKFFFAEIAKGLESLGHTVYFAVTAQKSKLFESVDYIDQSENTFFFDSFMQEYKSSSDYLMDDETWGDLFYSDFDRFFFHDYNLLKGNEYWKSISNGLYSYFKKIIYEKSIDVVLYENISNSFAYVANKVIQEKKGIYLGLMVSRIPGRYEIQTSIYEDEVKEIDSLTKNIYSQEEIAWFSGYIEKLEAIQPDYMKGNIINQKIGLSRLFSMKKIFTLIRYLKLCFKSDSTYDYQNGHPIGTLKSMYRLNFIKRYNESKSYRYYLSVEDVDSLVLKDKGNFYIYPTHYHPESSTSVLAQDYTNELNNIINIHNNLPVGTYLYVKDHISARGVQGHDFYKKIKSLPGVRLVHFDYNVKKLIKHSKGVITVTSTVGYEASLLGKPVFLFGNTFYQNFPNVFRAESFKCLRSLLSSNYETSKEEVQKYAIAYYRYTFKGHLLINKPKAWNKHYFFDLVKNINQKVEAIESKKNKL